MDWREKYASKLVSMDEAVRKIKSGDTLAAGIATGVPYKLLDALADYSLGHLEDVEFYYGAGFKPYKMGMPPFNGHLNVKSFFFGPIERAFVAHGSHFPYQPIHLSQTTRDRCVTHRGNVLGFVNGLLSTRLERHAAVVIGNERAFDLLCAADRLVKADLDRVAEEGREMLGLFEPARQAGRGYAQRIGRHVVKLLCVEHGVERAGYLLALVDEHARRAVDRDDQHILPAFLFKFHVPQGNAGLLTQGLYQLFHPGDDLLCLQSRPSLRKSSKQSVRSGFRHSLRLLLT